MQEIIEKVNAVLEKYSGQLENNGIKVTVSKRYFEESVGEQIRNSGESIILNEIEKSLDRKREKKKGYHHIRNRYHVIVLSVIPVKKMLSVGNIAEIMRFIFIKSSALISVQIQRNLHTKNRKYFQKSRSASINFLENRKKIHLKKYARIIFLMP